MKQLHEKQRIILELLKTHSSAPLSIKDLRIVADIDSPGVLYYHLAQLEKKGYLKRNPNNSKDYIVLESPEDNVVYIGHFGKAKCGHRGNFLDGDPLEYIPISSALLRFPSKDAFIVEAEGDSMQPRIEEGDIIIAKRQITANHGDIVVCTYKNEVLIKKFIRLEKSISLVSYNQENYTPILVDDIDDLFIAGIVKNILSYNS